MAETKDVNSTIVNNLNNMNNLGNNYKYDELFNYNPKKCDSLLPCGVCRITGQICPVQGFNPQIVWTNFNKLEPTTGESLCLKDTEIQK